MWTLHSWLCGWRLPCHGCLGHWSHRAICWGYGGRWRHRAYLTRERYQYFGLRPITLSIACLWVIRVQLLK